MERRRFLRATVQLTGATLATLVAIPGILGVLSPALVERGPRWRPLGPLAEFPVGQVRKAVVHLGRDDPHEALQEQSVYVWRPAPDDLVVFSRSCTDLGCPVTHDPGNGWFFCPCHGGIFDQHGVPRAGPPSRPLFRYAWRVVQDIVEVDVHSVPPMV